MTCPALQLFDQSNGLCNKNAPPSICPSTGILYIKVDGCDVTKTYGLRNIITLICKLII